MVWNWQREDWPHFSWRIEAIAPYEDQFLQQAGILQGIYRHVNEEEKRTWIIELITDEAVKTSAIEGELLNRPSVQSSIRKNFGLTSNVPQVPPAEQGIADMMTDLYKNFATLLSHQTLYQWHQMLMRSRRDLSDIGCYRTHSETMQVVSGLLDERTVHFEAPPSAKVKIEMDGFLKWFLNSQKEGANPLPPLTKAGLAHLYFVCIHPFEDGNGRIARAIAEKALSESLGTPTLIALSQTIERRRKQYYDALENNNKDNEVTTWLTYFAQTILDAQNYSVDKIEFLIEKTKFFDRARNLINPRQQKVLNRMFQEGPEGFKGGLSAENYIAISKTSRATATRDLKDLVEKKLLKKSGTLKSTRYALNIRVKKADVPEPSV